MACGELLESGRIYRKKKVVLLESIIRKSPWRCTFIQGNLMIRYLIVNYDVDEYLSEALFDSQANRLDSLNVKQLQIVI